MPAALPIGYFPTGEEDAVDLSRTARTTTVCASEQRGHVSHIYE